MELFPKNLRLGLYARVSHEERHEGQSIDSQVNELRRFGDQNQWLTVHVYEDDGWSGALLARPALDQLRDDARRGLFDAVLVNDVDRLARDVAHLGVIKRDLEAAGVKVIFRKLPTEASPMGNLMVNILGSFAEFEREMIADRTRRGRRHKVDVRKEFIGALPSYGLRYTRRDKATGTGGTLDIVPAQAAVVRDIFRWVDQETLSARKVVARLNERDVPTPKGGAVWQRSTVLRILRNETYAGVWHYYKHERLEPLTRSAGRAYRKQLKTSLRRRPRQEWLPVVLPEHLRIIGRDQWERVQRQLQQNRSFSRRNSKHEYLLRGLVICGACQRRYVGDPGHGDFYYRCSTRCKKLPTVRAADLDQVVWTALEEAVLNPQIIEDQVAQLQDLRSKETERGRTEAREGAALLKQVDAEESRLLAAYRVGALSAALLGHELEQLEARRSVLKKQMAELAPLAAAVDPSEVKRSVRYYCERVARRLGKLETAERQALLRILVKEILFKGDTVVIRGRIPRAQDDARGASIGEPGNGGRIATTALDRYGHNPVGAFQFELVAPLGRPLRARPPTMSGLKRGSEEVAA